MSERSDKVMSAIDDGGWFVGEVLGQPSPLEDGVWLVPGGAVDAAPPTVPAGQRARWTGAKWELNTLPAAPADGPVLVPSVVSLLGFQIALLRRGDLAAADHAVAALTGADAAEAQLWWAKAPVIARGDSLVATVAGAAGLSDTTVDALFVAASLPLR